MEADECFVQTVGVSEETWKGIYGPLMDDERAGQLRQESTARAGFAGRRSRLLNGGGLPAARR